MSDALGDRMKIYERRETSHTVLPRAPVYARIDGRCFSSFTKDMNRPYDIDMSRCMIETTKVMVKHTNALIGYTQSDEISLCWIQDKPDSELPFGGKIFKMTSCLASLTTASFLLHAQKKWPDKVTAKPPTFDCRVFSLPDKDELANAFLWRERDATKNAISMAARAYYGPSQLHLKNASDMQEMLFQKGVNFNDYPDFFKRGTFVRRETVERQLTDEELERIPEKHKPDGPVIRNIIQELTMPSFGSVTNRSDVITTFAEPITDSS